MKAGSANDFKNTSYNEQTRVAEIHFISVTHCQSLCAIFGLYFDLEIGTQVILSRPFPAKSSHFELLFISATTILSKHNYRLEPALKAQRKNKKKVVKKKGLKKGHQVNKMLKKRSSNQIPLIPLMTWVPINQYPFVGKKNSRN